VALYYNKDHFKAAGLYPNRLNIWQDLKAYAKKLTTKNRYGLELSIGTGEWLTFSTLLPFLWQAGGDFITSDGDKARFIEPCSVRIADVQPVGWIYDFVYDSCFVLN
jgi:ABC-type glycerol-3-phosphate transport system substrate-binding protein